MEVAILVLLIIVLILNILIAVVLVRFNDAVELKLDRIVKRMDRQDKDIQRLSQELLVRLPPMPYGVDIEERRPNLTIGPYDARIP